jgi:hypothetical protein
MANAYPRLNIYLDNPRLHEIIRIAAVQRGITLSAYCLEAIRFRLQEDGLLSAADIEANRQTAAAALDHLRQQVGPIGIPVRELVAEGRVR